MQFFNQAQLSYNGRTVNSNMAVGEVLGSLTMTKTAVTDEYTVGDDVTYVISIANSSASPMTGITVTDDLGGYEYDAGTLYPLTYVTGSVKYYQNGEYQPTAPTVTAGPPLAFSGITVPANGNVMLIYEATANEFAPASAGGTIVNTASVDENVTATETVSVAEAPDLSVTKSITPVPVTQSGTVTYTFVIQNFGNAAADADDNAVLSDVFDPVLTDIAVTLDGEPLEETTGYTYEGGTFATVDGVMTVPAADYERDPDTGAFTATPGVATLTVTGTI